MALKADITEPSQAISNEDLLKTLECPVCFKYMIPPITNCLTGHSICVKCLKIVHQCPMCRERFGKTRNFIAEDLARKLLFPCENKNFGCMAVLRYSDIEGHNFDCPQRAHKCIIDNCSWEGQKNKLIDHVAQIHPQRTLSGISSSFFWTCLFSGKVIFEYFLLSYSKEHFWVVLCSKPSTKTWTVSIQYIGKREKASEFDYSVTVKSMNKLYKHHFTDNVKDITVDMKAIEQSALFFELNDYSRKKFLQKNGKINIQLDIIKKTQSLPLADTKNLTPSSEENEENKDKK